MNRIRKCVKSKAAWYKIRIGKVFQQNGSIAMTSFRLLPQALNTLKENENSNHDDKNC